MSNNIQYWMNRTHSYVPDAVLKRTAIMFYVVNGKGEPLSKRCCKIESAWYDAAIFVQGGGR